MTSLGVLNIQNGKKATIISFLILNKFYVDFIPFSCVFFFGTSGVMGIEGGLLDQKLGWLPGSGTVCCVATGKWLILAFICKIITQMSSHSAVEFHF